MSRSTWFVSLGALCALVAAYAAMNRLSPKRLLNRNDREQALSATVRALSERVDRLSREQASTDLLAQMARSHAPRGEAIQEKLAPDERGESRAVDDGSAEHGPEDVAGMQQRATERALRRRELLSEQLRTETRDPEWARETEGRVAETIAKMNQSGLPSAQILSSECRTTLCQVDVEVPVQSEHQKFPIAFARVGLRSFALEQVEPDGTSTRWSVFLTRKGHEMARVPEVPAEH